MWAFPYYTWLSQFNIYSQSCLIQSVVLQHNSQLHHCYNRRPIENLHGQYPVSWHLTIWCNPVQYLCNTYNLYEAYNIHWLYQTHVQLLRPQFDCCIGSNYIVQYSVCITAEWDHGRCNGKTVFLDTIELQTGTALKTCLLLHKSFMLCVIV